MSRYLLALIFFAGVSAFAQSTSRHGPDCSGGWPTDMAQATLKNAGLLSNHEIDFAKTKTVRLASENIAKDLWHQVYLVRFVKKSSEELQAIVIHDASKEECSMTSVQVYVIAKRLSSD